MRTLTQPLNMSPGGIPPVIHVSQYDSDFTIVFTLFSTVGDFTIESGTTAMVRGTKSSGTGYSADAAINISAKTVTVTGNAQMTAAAGQNIFEITLLKGGKEISSKNFILLCERAALDADTITDESVLKELNAIIESAETATQAAEEAEDAADRAEAAAQTFVIDSTLTHSGQAADAKATGDAIAGLENEIAQIVPGLSSEAKGALLNCFAHVAWVDEHGQDYYDALYQALYNGGASGYVWDSTSGIAPSGMTYESIVFAVNNEYATVTKPVLFAGYGDKEVEIEMAVVSGGSTYASIGVVDKYNYGCRLTFSNGKPMLVAEHDNHSEKAYTVDGIDITQFNKYSISLNNGRVTFKINDVIISTGNSYRNAFWGQPIISPSNPALQHRYELVAKIKSIRYNNYGASNNKKVLKYYRNKGVVIGGSELENNTKRITTDLFYFPATHQVTVRLTGVVENNLQSTIKIIDQNGNVWQGRGSSIDEYNQGFFEPDLPVIPASQAPILWTNTEDELTTATLKYNVSTEWNYGKLQMTNGTLRILFADGQSTNNELNRAISGSVFVNGEEYVLEEGVY